ncbi:hypothetical protein Poli38472_008647 [Pythium oligandrum]|uniref:Apple domain-containing protein n=1 Tax=Pythium oligandrum TaxID=41045 RepID=A0A8K1C3Y6_PYTOL|nr:hypothetical protein Poli38472_008647 [Pythium oligandrum]|eukprot:TMW55999.1 hypothetical protein Poli38472_008647 [Pythium oligandrum]
MTSEPVISLEAWKKTAYYAEAYAMHFLPEVSYKYTTASSSDGGKFTMATNEEGGSAAAEEKKRFDQALEVIEVLKHQHPYATFSMNTPFALMTEAEFHDYVTQHNIHPAIEAAKNASKESGSRKGGPMTRAVAPGERVDWQEKGCVSDIKDQARCGACWAFSATAAMESGVCVETNFKSLPNLADQQLISCDDKGESRGCAGGYASYTLPRAEMARCVRWINMPLHRAMRLCLVQKDPEQMEDQVRKRPVSVFLYSGSRAFQFYSGGILTGENCDKSGPHSALAVGLGEENGVPYWRLKNQWGTKWGEAGYLRIQRRYSGDDEGACGVESFATWPTFKEKLVVDAPNPNFQPTSAPEPSSQELTPEPTPPPPPARTPQSTTPTPEPSTTAPMPSPEPSTTPSPEPTPSPTSKQPATPKPANEAPPIDQRKPTSTPAASQEGSNSQQCGRLDGGVDYLGNDIKNEPASSVDECCALCHGTPGCNAFTFTNWSGGRCWLKSRAGVIVSLPGAVSSSLHDISKCTHQCSPQEIGYDYPGNAVESKSAQSADQCCDLCQQNTNCHAYTWAGDNGGICYLKSRKEANVELKSSRDITSAVVYKCRNLQPNVDFQGQDLTHEPARSPEECCAICKQTKGCAAFSWSDCKAGTCWLKSDSTNAIPTHGVVFAAI